MPLTDLRCGGARVSDLSPLEDCHTLTILSVTYTKFTPAALAAVQKALPNCKIEWDGVGKATKPWDTPAFQQWVKATQVLPAEQQIEAVSKKLMELNPGFDGKLTSWTRAGPPVIENGVVTGLGFVTDQVTDVSPVRAMSGLRRLEIGCSNPGSSKLFDLSPLAGMPLWWLDTNNTVVSDLSPLGGMRLQQVFIAAIPKSPRPHRWPGCH